MAALYTATPTAAESYLLGWRQPDDLSGAESMTTVWEDAWPVIQLFSRRLSTQWRCGPGGLVGLDYTLAYAELDRVALDEDERQTFLDLLGIVERAAMEAIQPPVKK